MTRLRLWLPVAIVSTALLGILLAASEVRPMTVVVTPSDRYGVRLDRGQLQFMHGQQLTLERYDHGRARERKIGWNEGNEYWQSLTRLTHFEQDPTRLRVALDPWRPFIQPASASAETQVPWPDPQPDGTVRVTVIRVGKMIQFVGASLWPPFLTSGVGLFVVACIRLRRRRLLPPLACLTCGYDLRASFDRCPECGEAIVRSG